MERRCRKTSLAAWQGHLWPGGGSSGSPSVCPSFLLPESFYVLLCHLILLVAEGALFYRWGLGTQRGKVIFRVTHKLACGGGCSAARTWALPLSRPVTEVSSPCGPRRWNQLADLPAPLASKLTLLDESGGLALPALSFSRVSTPTPPVLVP